MSYFNPLSSLDPSFSYSAAPLSPSPSLSPPDDYSPYPQPPLSPQQHDYAQPASSSSSDFSSLSNPTSPVPALLSDSEFSSSTDSSAFDSVVSEARSAFQANNYELGLEYYLEAQAMKPNDESLNYEILRRLTPKYSIPRVNQYRQRALNTVESAIKHHPHSAILNYAKGCLLFWLPVPADQMAPESRLKSAPVGESDTAQGPRHPLAPASLLAYQSLGIAVASISPTTAFRPHPLVLPCFTHAIVQDPTFAAAYFARSQVRISMSTDDDLEPAIKAICDLEMAMHLWENHEATNDPPDLTSAEFDEQVSLARRQIINAFRFCISFGRGRTAKAEVTVCVHKREGYEGNTAFNSTVASQVFSTVSGSGIGSGGMLRLDDHKEHKEQFISGDRKRKLPDSIAQTALHDQSAGVDSDAFQAIRSRYEEFIRSEKEKTATQTVELNRLQDHYAHVQQSLNCIQCGNQRRNTLFGPCMHLVACQGCAELLAYCPFKGCGQPIVNRRTGIMLE